MSHTHVLDGHGQCHMAHDSNPVNEVLGCNWVGTCSPWGIAIQHNLYQDTGLCDEPDRVVCCKNWDIF